MTNKQLAEIYAHSRAAGPFHVSIWAGKYYEICDTFGSQLSPSRKLTDAVNAALKLLHDAAGEDT